MLIHQVKFLSRLYISWTQGFWFQLFCLFPFCSVCYDPDWSEGHAYSAGGGGSWECLPVSLPYSPPLGPNPYQLPRHPGAPPAAGALSPTPCESQGAITLSVAGHQIRLPAYTHNLTLLSPNPTITLTDALSQANLYREWPSSWFGRGIWGIWGRECNVTTKANPQQ